MTNLGATFDDLRTVQQYGLTLREEGVTDEEWSSHIFADAEVDYAISLVKEFSLSRYQATTLMRTSTEEYNDMVSAVTTAVQNALNTTIREGQVNQSIETIRQIVGYKVSLSLNQVVVTSVLRSCVQPNMVIETETTELARQKAMTRWNRSSICRDRTSSGPASGSAPIRLRCCATLVCWRIMSTTFPSTAARRC